MESLTEFPFFQNDSARLPRKQAINFVSSKPNGSIFTIEIGGISVSTSLLRHLINKNNTAARATHTLI